jgi:hypothetical protein
LFALIQGWFKKKKKLEKLPGKLENSGKTKSAFFYGTGWNDLSNFFLMFVIIRMRVYVKNNWKSCPENWKIREKLKVLFCDGYA